ncbi:DUF6233 domain-containing protein [Streptomyces griseorubiginosus]|uniref:DUF6233 domain-containing protein n=1 Tax=Streptomyces griseorubiginosus TaxID=67304 RepID=UPI0033C670D2
MWHALWLDRIDRKIARLERRKAEEEHGRKRRPPTPEWVVEVGIGTGRPPVQVHAGTCHMIGSRRRPVSRDEARRLLAEGLRACTHCQPDTQLHIIDLAAASSCQRRPGPVSQSALPACGRGSNSRPKSLFMLTTGQLVRAARNRNHHDHSPAPDHGTGPVGAGLLR